MNKLIILSLCMFVVSACANLNSISRTTDFSADIIKNDKEEQINKTLKVIHLDAKQRVAFMSDFGTICAEPSPDALSAYASSLSGSLTTTSGEAVNIANSLSESSASIGLRTQTIQLLRDGMYRICELYNARALDQTGVLVLQKNYQDIMIGMLAIEQLTGVVKADQATLSSNSQASATNSLKNIEESIKSTTDLKTKQEVVVAEATAKKDTAKTNADNAQTKYEEALEEAAGKDNADQSAILLSKEERDKNKHVFELAEANESAQKAILKNLESQLALLKEHEGDISQLATSNSSSKATLSGGSIPTMDSVAAVKIADTVKEITFKVLDQDYKESACIAYMTTQADKIEKTADKIENLAKDKINKIAKLQQKSPKKDVSMQEEAFTNAIKAHEQSQIVFKSVIEVCKGILEKKQSTKNNK